MSRPERAWEDARPDEVEDNLARWDRVLEDRRPEFEPRPARPERRQPERDAEKALRPRRRIRYGRLALVVLGGYLAVMALSGEMTLRHVNAQASALAREASILKAENRVLAQRVKLLHTVSYVDELARTEMGYVSPGEVPLVPAKGAAAAGK